MSTAPKGRIVTFYSFKGGVGRTMALANVAFLAAMNGRKVLMMDWDLEAPGLAYYYRGMTPPETAQTRGVLDLACEWVAAARAAASSDDADALIRRYDDGVPFRDCVLPLAADRLPSHGALDLISVGAARIAAAENQSYEDVLAHFSWADLMESDGGGLLIDALRRWAKQHYDLILVDSRTGLSDVAGICTLQLPDSVALCFALNRQNIDGVAKVAGAIRAKRGQDITLHAVPMRLPTSQTFESSDAHGYAMRELARVGGFSRDEVQDDFKALGIPSAEAIPFYESLAPFLADDPDNDPLTRKYLRLTREFVSGQDLTVPEIGSDWASQIRRRLQPRIATFEYLDKLQDADSTRATSEILLLLDAISDSDPDTLDDEYVEALAKTATVVAEEVDGEQAGPLYRKLLEVLRQLSAHDPARWGLIFAENCSEYASNFLFAEYEESIELREEIDATLSRVVTHEALLWRIRNFREMAGLHSDRAVFVALETVLGRMAPVLATLRQEQTLLSPEQRQHLDIAEIDYHRMRGELAFDTDRHDLALQEYSIAEQKIKSVEVEDFWLEVNSMESDIHAHLAQLTTGEQAAHHALAAVESEGYIFFNIAMLARIVLDSDDADIMAEFVLSAFSPQRQNLPLNLRVTQNTLKLLPAIASLVSQSGNPVPALSCLAQWLDAVAQPHPRRRVSAEAMAVLAESAIALAAVLESAGLDPAQYPALNAMATGEPLPRPRPTPPPSHDD